MRKNAVESFLFEVGGAPAWDSPLLSAKRHAEAGRDYFET